MCFIHQPMLCTLQCMQGSFMKHVLSRQGFDKATKVCIFHLLCYSDFRELGGQSPRAWCSSRALQVCCFHSRHINQGWIPESLQVLSVCTAELAVETWFSKSPVELTVFAGFFFSVWLNKWSKKLSTSQKKITLLKNLTIIYKLINKTAIFFYAALYTDTLHLRMLTCVNRKWNKFIVEELYVIADSLEWITTINARQQSQQTGMCCVSTKYARTLCVLGKGKYVFKSPTASFLVFSGKGLHVARVATKLRSSDSQHTCLI